MKRLIQITFLLGVAPLLFAAHNDEKGSHDLPSSTSSAWVDVIIQFNKTSSGAQLQGQLRSLENMLQQYGQNGQQNGQQQGQHEDKVFNSINALHLKIPAALIPALKANPAVRY